MSVEFHIEQGLSRDVEVIPVAGAPISIPVPKHRNGLGCIGWAKAQPRKPMFVIGDIVRDIESGNIGIVTEFEPANDHTGWPSEYALEELPGCGKLSRYAWFYDLDLEMVKPSTAREFMKVDGEQ